MASNYPTSLDSFTDPLANSPMNNPSHAGQHQDLNNSVEQLEKKLGTGTSNASSASANQVLVANGSGGSSWAAVPEYSLQTGLVYITSATLGAGTLSINNCFTSTYANYRIVMSNIKTASPGAVVLNLRKNGADSGINYFFGGLYRLYASGGGDTTGNGINYWLSVSADNTSGSSASFDIYNPQVNTYTHYICQSANLDAGQFVSGVHKVADQYDGISFIPYGVAGSSGTITVYGYRKI